MLSESTRRLNLVLRLGIEIARIMPLMQLLFQRPIRAIDDPAPLYRRPGIHLLRPALNIGIALHVQKFASADIGAV